MQKQRKFEGRIPKRNQQTTPMTTLPADNTKTNSLTTSTDTGIVKTESAAPTDLEISSQNHQTEQTIVFATMLPAATTLNGIPSHHQPQYITMQAPVQTLSPSTHALNSPITAPATTDGSNVYQFKSEIVCDNQNQYQQQRTSQSHDNHDNVVTTISSSSLLLTTTSSTTSPPSMSTTTNSTNGQNSNSNETTTQATQQPQYRYITASSANQTNGEGSQHQASTATIVYENYEGDVAPNGSTIIKFEGGEYEIIKSEINDNNIIQTNAGIIQHHSIQQAHTQSQQQQQKQNQKQEVIVKYEDQSLDNESYEEFQSVTQSPQKEQLQNLTYQTISHHDKEELNQTINDNVVVSTAGTLTSIKQKRKRKTRSIASDEQGEYLEKMSVRGLDIQRYEHIIDGVSYCLVCAKNDIYKTFKNKYSFQRHAYLFHEGDNRKIFACPICNKEFSRPDKMKMHKKDKHGDIMAQVDSNGGGTPEKNNLKIVETPPPAKRTRASTAKTPRARKPRTTLANMNNKELHSTDNINKDAAAQKRLAQIDSVLDEVQNADGNQPANNNNIQIQHQTIIPSTSSQSQQQPANQQQLPPLEFSGMILPGGAQLALANPGATSSIMQPPQQRVITSQSTQQQQTTLSAQNHPPTNAGPTTLIYSNQIDLQQALLQQQLHGQSIMIQDQAGNLVPLQSLQTLDGTPTIYTTTQTVSGQQRQQILQTQATQPQQQHTLITSHPTHIKVESSSTQTQQASNNNVTSHTVQHQQPHYEIENVSYLSSSATAPTVSNQGTNDQHVIGTVQSYQILTQDGLQTYQTSANKHDSNEIEICPYSMSATTPQFTYSSHLTTNSDPTLHPPHHQQTAGTNEAHQTISHQTHHQNSTSSQHHSQQHHQTTHHQLPSLTAPHHQFMELKNELLIKSSDTYSLDAATSMYHLPFSPTSMINAVSDVNSSSLLETKEISINNNTGVSNIVASVPIINTIPSSNLKIIKATSGKAKKSPIIISNIKKFESTAAVTATKPTTQLKESCQPVQILLTRKIGGGLTTINTNNQHNQLNNTILTSTKLKGVIQKRTNDGEAATLKKLSEQTLENTNCTTVNTEEIMKKFRIPKGIALTPKFGNDMTISRHIPTTAIPHILTPPSISPSCAPSEDVDNTSALVEYVEEIYDDDEEEETEVINAEEIESCEYQEYEEADIQDAEELEGSDLIEEIESSDQQDLILSEDANDYSCTQNNSSENLIATTRSQQPTTDSVTNLNPPQIIQIAQSNGTISCFQLPPNTIVLQSPDGALLATTAPHPSKTGQQQIIAIQDFNSISDILNFSANSTTVSSPNLTSSHAPVILTSDGANLPVVVTTSVNSSATSDITNQISNDAVITTNESLVKAQQQQILA